MILDENPTKDWWMEEAALIYLQHKRRTTQCHGCKYFVDELMTGMVFEQDSSRNTYCQDCIEKERLNLPVCTQCGHHAPAAELYGISSYDGSYPIGYNEDQQKRIKNQAKHFLT
ncbi:11021_t:CDS:2 [Ambispora gerdemannii]|uniref:11021_t:CDS:1 n=1 Tax=Ambispora gerdemannii TaxID=144530 RepID=A0A9N9D7I7_9GLOM|nr:11021_t:CDS:2 [Ambispora gerdemannii]